VSLKNIFKTGQLELWSKYKDKLRGEHRLSYLFWESTLNCNFSCKHCGSSAGMGKRFDDELTTTEIKKVFADIAKEMDPKSIMIAVTGGEPMMRPDLFEVMKYAHGLGFAWGMVTNGSLLTKEKIAKAKDAGMATVVVSIDGIGEVHDKFRGFPGAYKKAIAAVKGLAEANFLDDLQITTSTHRANVGQLEEMYKEFSALGITSWRVMNIDPIGRANENREIILNDTELKKLLEFIKDKRKRKSKPEVVYGCEGFLGLDYEGEVRPWLFNCNTGINTGSILANGDIFVCPNVPRNKDLIQGNVRRDNFVDIWNNKFEFFRNKERTACKKCKECDDWDYCLGNSFHLWDFKKNEPKICHVDRLKNLSK
jgi:radical SAM protein with 4Fe4S-binding SPASM domain